MLVYSHTEEQIEKIGRKWTEIRPFFQQLKREFGSLHLLKVQSDNKKAVNKSFHIYPLMQLSDEKDHNRLPAEILELIERYVDLDVSKKDLDATLTKVKNVSKTDLQDYIHAFLPLNVSLPIMAKLKESKNPFLLIKNGHFNFDRISDLLLAGGLDAWHENPEKSEFREQKKEIQSLILAGIHQNDMRASFYLIAKDIALWSQFYSALINDPKLKILSNLPMIPPQGEKTYLQISWLWEESTQIDYYKLSGATKWQLRNLINKKVDSKQLLSILNELYLKVNNPTTNDSSENNKNDNLYLAIGLGVGGGVISLIVVSGFLYWFFRVKK